ncbi:Nn.00g077750.m01.CDS01 [Neocucurbitaria sp. VM-36]
MANLLGWKDILRPIRDRYRHLFPVPDTGPTPEERRKQREKDRLNGFTYFDTFKQVEAWTEAESDPLQRANTPALQRRRSLEKTDGLAKADIVLIHDYAGNYHNYERVHETGMDEEMYACEYLQYVSSFIYFSHKLVCIPPPTWTNTLHRNGVLALGTILIESQTNDSEKLLQYTNNGNGVVFPMVKTLCNIAQHYGFDGWLLNIEKPFPKANWNADILEMFICQLKDALGIEAQLIWYDALTSSNKISYQNALNSSNITFASASNSLLTNYCWTEVDAKTSRQVALDNEISLQNIFFGIDMWAQNVSKLTHPRITYPEKGGGGTNTGVAVKKLAEIGLSAGIFAPAWSFEHFLSRGQAVERAVWEGEPFSEDLECSCGNCSARHQPNLEFPIIRSAKEFAAGSESFFYTDFSRAFGKHKVQDNDAVFGGHSRHAQLGAQSILPCALTSRGGDQDINLAYHLVDFVDQTGLVIDAQGKLPITANGHSGHFLPLYKLDMPADGPLNLKASCRNLLLSTTGAIISFYLRSTRGLQFLPIPEGNGLQSIQTTIAMANNSTPNIRLQELGINLRGFNGNVREMVQLLEIFEIGILPQSALQIVHSCNISDIRIEHRGEGENKHVRLCWKSDGTSDATELRVEGLPYSKITGPISYYNIQLDGLRLGRAYAMEHPIVQSLVDRLKDREVEVEITGIGFDGRKIAESKTTTVI